MFHVLVLIALVCSLVCTLPLSAADQPAGDYNTIRVVMDNNYPPFSFRDAGGNLVGISVDMWRLWEKQTGKNVTITGLPWENALERMEAGEFDVIDTVFYSEERAKIYDFSPPYADVDVVIFFDANLSGISTIGSLDGFVVGMHKGDSTVGDVKRRGVIVREYESYEAVVTAAKNGEIVVFILDKPAGVYYLYHHGMQDRFRYTAPILSGELHRAVRKGNTALLAEINNGFHQIPRSEYDALERTWYGMPVENTESLRLAVLVTGSIVLIVVLLVIWNYMLKKTVTEKTAELQAELEQRRRAEDALNRATRKLNLLNAITFTDIRNAIFSLAGYLELEKQVPADEKTLEYRNRQEAVIRTISNTLQFAKNYQDLGMKPPAWQDTTRVFLFGISHIDISKLSRRVQLDNVEIYADPLLENVFLTLAENVIIHAKKATEISLWYKEIPEGLLLVFEDNGVGIPMSMKEKIFERRFEIRKGMGLFLVREILSITGITIRENGIEGEGARFEMTVPKGSYRIKPGASENR